MTGGVPFEIADRYEDRGPIGRGGMGEVRRVFDRRLECELAMKILAGRLVSNQGARSRFLAEAKLTARLQHPYIVAVHDRGELEDGRLWFTMREVHGRTLAHVIDDLHDGVRDGRWPTEGEMTLHRAIDAFRRLCEGVAFAHAHGVVHRDLKPSNLMVGELGEVQVMDWGLAKRVGHAETPRRSQPPEDPSLTQDGELVGTPAYMSPEQARGLPFIGPPSDVWSLGACLRRILTNRPPVPGGSPAVLASIITGRIKPLDVNGDGHPPLPLPLVTICERAMATPPDARFADAAELARELGAWLEGARRRERAREIVAEASALEPHVQRLRFDATRRRQEAAAMLRALPYSAPAEDKHAAWELEDDADGLEQDAALIEVRWLQQLRSALEEAPDLEEAHERLADYYRVRMEDAIERRDGPGAARLEALLRAHDRGQHAVFLRGEGRVSLVTDPPGAKVTAFRYVEKRRRLVLERHRELGVTPLVEASLPHGSYLLVIEAEGRPPVRYPVLIERGQHWDGVRPGDVEPYPIVIPTADQLGDGYHYVPAGRFVSGGDPKAAESLPRRSVWVDGVYVQKDPVTNAEFLAWLNGLVAEGRTDEAERHQPRAASDEQTPLFGRTPEGRFVLPDDDASWLPGCPVTCVSWDTAVAFAEARGARLLDELEWEKAARGVDGRAYACGDHLEPSWANVTGSLSDGIRRLAVGTGAHDVSPYEVRGTIGNTREWCANLWRPEGPPIEGGRLVRQTGEGDQARAARGGAYHSVIELSRAAVRYAGDPKLHVVVVGLRLARSWP